MGGNLKFNYETKSTPTSLHKKQQDTENDPAPSPRPSPHATRYRIVDFKIALEDDNDSDDDVRLVNNNNDNNNSSDDDDDSDDDSLEEWTVRLVFTPAMEALTLRHVEESIEMMALPEKAAYMEACSVDPRLIYTESNPIDLIRFEKYNSWAAARRLVAHWQMRKELFGSRAFRPLYDLSGEGALDAQDIAVIRTGSMSVLPTGCHTDTVVFFDRSRLSWDMMRDNPAKLRAFFYTMSRVSDGVTQNEQSDGFLFLIELNTGSRIHFSPFILRTCSVVMNNVFPMKPRSMHLEGCLPHDRIGNNAFMKYILPVFLHTVSSLRNTPVKIHMGSSRGEIRDQLVQGSN
jgi:hypothetical protein